nr:DoxX family protein [uncultured Chryseobacterium sp.]
MFIDNIRKNIPANYFIIFTRLLIGFSFIPSGLIKVFGQRFTSLPDSNPVGHLFESFYQLGLYWNFLGLAQVLAALLLMSQRFATLGALLFLPIISNILMITLSIDFSYTYVITTLLFFAVLLLLLWDYQKIVPLFLSSSKTQTIVIGPDLISVRWQYYGTYLSLFLTAVCCMPYIFSKESVNPAVYFIAPLFITLFSFLFMLYTDIKKYKGNNSTQSITQS